jgi:GTP cyclohydrolase II
MTTTTSAPTARRIHLSETSEDVLAAVAEACGPTGRASIDAVAACCPTQTPAAVRQRLGGLDARGLVCLLSATVALTAAGTSTCNDLYS